MWKSRRQPVSPVLQLSEPSTSFNTSSSSTVKPCSNGPIYNGIPPITDTISWSLESISQLQNSAYSRKNFQVPQNPLERDLTITKHRMQHLIIIGAKKKARSTDTLVTCGGSGAVIKKANNALGQEQLCNTPLYKLKK